MRRWVITGLAAWALWLLPAGAADAAGPPKPAAAPGKYRALMDEYRKALHASDRVFERAKSDEERKQVRAAFARERSGIVGRLLAFAEADPADGDAPLALFFVLHPDTAADRKSAEAAVRLFQKDHLSSDRIAPLLRLFEGSPASEKPLRAVLEKNPHRAVQAQAGVALALVLKGKGDAGQAAEAEKLLERVVKKYADVKAAAGRAEAELFEIRHLAVGKALPGIEGKDADGKDLKLSDYKGKVIVVEFWATWCAPCVASMPHKRALVKRLEGKPFALLGVNLDHTREGLKKSEEKHGITWRSFHDRLDGPITRRHNIKDLPTNFVLDAKGVIRCRGVRGEELDKAVDQLLAELGKEGKK